MEDTERPDKALQNGAMESNKPFPETLRAIMKAGDISQRELVRRCRARGWGSNGTINALVRGALRPSAIAMEAIAEALGERPQVFAEYRLAKAREELDPGTTPAELRKALRALSRMTRE